MEKERESEREEGESEKGREWEGEAWAPCCEEPDGTNCGIQK